MDQAEKLRNVVKLKNQNLTQNARVITVTSGKGGVGKSNVAVNLAVQMQKLGKRVLIFDADFGLANVEVMFGAIPEYNLSDVIYRGKAVRDIITEGPVGIGFISGGTGITGMNDLSKEQILYLVKGLRELDEMADVILVDTGAGISDHVLEFVIASPEVLVITTPEPSSLTDSYSLLKALYRNPIFLRDKVRINIIANRVNSTEEGNAVFSKLESVVSQFLKGEIYFLGMIPQDREMENAVRSQKVVSIEKPNAPSSRAFKVLTNNYLNHEYEKMSVRGGIAQIIFNILSRISS